MRAQKAILLDKIQKKSEFICPEKGDLCILLVTAGKLLLHFNFDCNHLVPLEVR